MKIKTLIIISILLISFASPGFCEDDLFTHHPTFDVNSDGQIGLAEAIAILQMSTGIKKAETEQENLRAIVKQKTIEQGLAGAVLAVLKPEDETPAIYSYGVSDKISEKLMSPTTKFRCGSITKSFVSFTILQLAQEEKLTLEDSVNKWLPGVIPTAQGQPANYTGYDSNRITIKHLLQHRAGITDYTMDVEWQDTTKTNPTKQWTDIELVSLGIKHPPMSDPDDQTYGYTNMNYVILGMIIEAVTGNDWKKEIRTRVIEPLNLKDTMIPEPGDVKIPGVAHGYINLYGVTGGKFGVEGEWVDFYEMDASMVGAGGALISTPSDISIWLKELVNNDSGLLTAPFHSLLLNEMQPMYAGYPGYDYGFGVAKIDITGDGVVDVFGHVGQVDGSQCMMRYHLETNISTCACSNMNYPDYRRIATAITNAAIEYLTQD